MGEYVVPSVTTGCSSSSMEGTSSQHHQQQQQQHDHFHTSMTLEETETESYRHQNTDAAANEASFTITTTTERSWSNNSRNAATTTGTLLSDALSIQMTHSNSNKNNNNNNDTTATMESSNVDTSPTTAATNVVDAATLARQKRRRKVQQIRLQQQQKKKMKSQYPRAATTTLSLMESTVRRATKSTITTTTTTVLPPLPRLMQSLLDHASHHDRTKKDDEYSNQASSSSSDNVSIIIPDAKGLQDICHRLHDKKEGVAIPTECTYEIIHPFQYNTTASVEMDTSKQQQPSQSQSPYYIYIPSVSILETCPFWRHVLPKKSYAIRKEPTSTTAIVSTFNETVHVLRRLSTKCWPGPILIYVQVSQPIDGLTVTVPSSDAPIIEAVTTATPLSSSSIQKENEETNKSISHIGVQHYVAIRKPCHPLSRKVCSEYYKRQFRYTSFGTGGTNSNPSSCTSTPSASPMFTSSMMTTMMTPETPRLSSVSSRLSLQLAEQQHQQHQPVPPPPPFMLTPPYRRVESSISLATSTTTSSIPCGHDNDVDGETPVPSSIGDDKHLRSGTPQQLESKNVVGLTQESTAPQPFLLVGTPMMKGNGWNRSKQRKKLHHHHSSTTTTAEDDCHSPKYVRTADEAIAALTKPSDDTQSNCTDSNNDIINVSAVLHGEEQYEILSVPTCMYQEPYPTSIWIDSTNRIVRIKSNKQDQQQRSKDVIVTTHDETDPTPHSNPPSRHSQQQQPQQLGRTMSPHSTIMTSSSSFLSLQQEQPYHIDETSILQALRTIVSSSSSSTNSGQYRSMLQPPSNLTSPMTHNTPSPTPTKVVLSPKERILHAVLLKWNVVTED